jgi:hypothetical protein
MSYRKFMYAGAALAVCVGAAACGTTPGERALSGGAIGAATGAAIGNNVGDGNATRGAVIGGVAGAIGGAATAPSNHNVNRRQYYDQRTGRYYFYDPGTNRYYYENGAPYP